MNELQLVLQSLSEKDRQVLAHELLAALEGRRTAAADGYEEVSEEAQPLQYGETRNVKSADTLGAEYPSEPAADWKRGAEQERKITEPGYSRLPVEMEGKRLWPAETPGESGRVMTLLREVPAMQETQGIQIRSSLSEASGRPDEYCRMREISEYFHQDSRRYDAGFTRY